MVLCVHGEVTPDAQPDDLLREYDFIPHLEWMVQSFPVLKIVVEHVSDRRMLQTVLGMPDNVAASITAHHPFVTYWDAEAKKFTLSLYFVEPAPAGPKAHQDFSSSSTNSWTDYK